MHPHEALKEPASKTMRRWVEYNMETNEILKTVAIKDDDEIHGQLDAGQDFLLWNREGDHFSYLFDALWAEPRRRVKLEVSEDDGKTWTDMEYLIFYQSDGVWFQSPAVAFQAPALRGRSSLKPAEQNAGKDKSHERARPT